MAPRVSVVVPTYNNADYIQQTVEAVLAQTFADFELLVADHSSTDRTWDLLQRYADDPRVRLLTTPPGGGAARNWNRVTDAASGELLKLVCGDDLIYPEMLSAQVAAFDAHDEGVVLVSSTRDIVDASGRMVFRNHGLGGLSGRVDGRSALRRSVRAGANLLGEPACVLLRRSVLERVGGWHGDPGFVIDQATYARVLLYGDLVVVPGPLGAFRLSATQWSIALAKEQARSVAQLHEQMAALQPGLLSRRDVRRGNVRATSRALQRRLVYLYLGDRLRPPT